jgi:hypothetical protein
MSEKRTWRGERGEERERERGGEREREEEREEKATYLYAA